MRILFVYSNINSICTKKCSFELAKVLTKYSITKVVYYKKLSSDIIKNYDIIIFQRIGDGEIIEKKDKKNIINIIIENKEKKFVYFIDDLVLESQDGLPKEMLILCDAVMCSSDTLCNIIRKYNKNVYRFSTFIDCTFYDSIITNDFEKFTISWVSNGGLGIEIMNELIIKIELMDIDLNLIAIGGQTHKLIKKDFLKCYGVIPEVKMIQLIKGSNILLNPMTVNNRLSNIIKFIYKSNINEFLNSKAEIKYLTAGMCQSCLLTSEIESYQKAIINGVNGFILPNDSDEWIDLIVSLYNNIDYLNTIIKNSYDDIKNKYDINIISKDIYNQLEKIMNKNKIT